MWIPFPVSVVKWNLSWILFPELPSVLHAAIFLLACSKLTWKSTILILFLKNFRGATAPQTPPPIAQPFGPKNKLQMYFWYFPKKCRGTGIYPPPSNACVCVREKQGRKIKSQNEGGGERNQINARIYAPALYLKVIKLSGSPWANWNKLHRIESSVLNWSMTRNWHNWSYLKELNWIELNWTELN